MEISSAKCLYELGMDDSSFYHQYQTNPLDYSLDGLNYRSFSSERYYPESTHNTSGGSHLEASQAAVERPAKQLKTEYTSKASPSSSWIISFEESNSISPATCQQVYGQESAGTNPSNEIESHIGNIKNMSSLISQGCYQYVEEDDKRAGSMTRNPLHAQEHVIAERKRRENLSQRFIALSAILPGLKKIDKASILGDTIKHLKQLQEHVKTVEEQAAKMAKESKFIVKKTHIFIDDEISFEDHQSNLYLPEIEARVWNRDVIIRIHCEQNKGCIASILSEIENLHLTVINSNVLPFGNSTLEITIVAQMNFELGMPANDLLKNLRHALLKLL
ncbi:hypothetical protein ACOSQ4_023736 [Xanthoceras sorbifolium]